MRSNTLHEIGKAIVLESVSAVDRTSVNLLYHMYSDLRGMAIESGRLLKEPGRSLENQSIIAKRVIELAEKQAQEYPLYVQNRNEERVSDYVARALEHLGRGDMRAAEAALQLAKHYL